MPKDKEIQVPHRSTREEIMAAPAAGDAPTVEPQPVEAASEPQLPNGFFIQRVITDDGNIQVDLQSVGDARLTEAETVLKLALNVLREKFNL